MTSLDRYILRQCLMPLAMILFVTTLIVWMTQTLQRVDILVDYGQGLLVFGYLSILIIPSLLAIIIPFAVFGAVVYALYRMHADSEIAVMFAAGVGRLRIAAPLLLVTFVCALATFYVNADLMPRSYRTMKERVADIRADFASSLLRSGEFTSVIDGFTIYVEDARPGGQFVGLLINDHRNGEMPETYMAERAVLQDTDAGPVMFLRDGNIQRVARYTGEVNIVRFEEWAINLATMRSGRDELQLELELTERYLGELFNPDLSQHYDRVNETKLIAEGHGRIAAPLYAFAYVLIGLFALIGGAYSRRGYFLRVAAAGAGIFALRVLGFVTQSLAEQTGFFWLIYLVPLSVIAVFAFLLFGPKIRLPAQPETEAA